MRKLFVTLLLGAASTLAFAQHSTPDFDPDGWLAVGYNYNLNVPDGMVHSGLCIDLCLFEYGFPVRATTTLSVGILDLQIDQRFLKKDALFNHDGTVSFLGVTGATSSMRDFVFSFPLGVRQKLGGAWGASLYVAPGVGLISYQNKYVEDNMRHRHNVSPVNGRAGFRLDIKAAVWYQDLGLYLRYQPVGFNPKDSEHKIQTLSVGLALRY